MPINHKIALQFSDMYQLWAFAKQLTCKSLEIIPGAKSLLCDCTEEEIRLALSQYGATLLEGNYGTFSHSYQPETGGAKEHS
jgi:hypothetical protein